MVRQEYVIHRSHLTGVAVVCDSRADLFLKGFQEVLVQCEQMQDVVLILHAQLEVRKNGLDFLRLLTPRLDLFVSVDYVLRILQRDVAMRVLEGGQPSFTNAEHSFVP